MSAGLTGLGTVINVATVLVGALLGMWVGHRLPERTRSVVTDSLGLTTVLVAGLSCVSVTDPALRAAVGAGVPVLIVLGSLLIGSITGSLLRIEERLEGLAGALQARVARQGGIPAAGGAAGAAGMPGDAGSAAGMPRRTPEDDIGAAVAASVQGAEPAGESTSGARGGMPGGPDAANAIAVPGTGADAAHAARERFIEGWLTASLLFCVGPLTILGSLSDGLGRGIEQLTLKSVLDGFAALAFASSFGFGVLMSALSVAVVQGSITALGVLLGSVLPDAHIAALTATGGLMLAGIGLRLLRIRDVPVGNMLPALIVAPLLTQLVASLR